MSLECISFWLTCWLLFELVRVKLLVTQLTLVLSLVILAIATLFALELDLLATFILAVYSSVFIAIALLALHFGPFWMPATQQDGQAQTPSILALAASFIAALVLSASAYFQQSTTPSATLGWALSFLWQDVYAGQQFSTPNAATLLHWFFYRAFILETVGLNIYLFLGLVGTVTLIYLRSLWLDSNSLAKKVVRAQWRSEGFFEHGSRIRTASRFRRQTRRANTSQIRHR